LKGCIGAAEIHCFIRLSSVLRTIPIVRFIV